VTARDGIRALAEAALEDEKAWLEHRDRDYSSTTKLLREPELARAIKRIAELCDAPILQPTESYDRIEQIRKVLDGR